MSVEKTVVMESGTENRKLEWGLMPDGKAYVREESRGDLMAMSFDAAERETTLTFVPSGVYSLADVADTVENHADDCFIADIEDALVLWGIPYTRDENAVPLPA
ncbi:MAG: hypothetical protein GX481_00765 [Atopobium sp.]|nr:hypothetical protein [Atopobium sp.]